MVGPDSLFHCFAAEAFDSSSSKKEIQTNEFSSSLLAETVTHQR